MEIRGYVKAVLRGADGKVKLTREGSNLVVAAGKAFLAECAEASPGPTRFSHIALGSSGIVLSDLNTTLSSEIAGSRTAIAAISRIDNELTYDVIITATGTWTVEEAGIFNAGAAGTMLARWLTQSFTMGNSETLEITWTLNFGG